MKRAIIVVIDSMGIGAMPDCREFNDVPECNTLKNVCKFNHGLKLPNMAKMGLGNIQDFEGLERTDTPTAKYGTMFEKSKGKDTTTGHWEIAGLISEKPFATFPNGFPAELIEKFIKETNCGGVLANIPASGTVIIEQLNDEHHRTKFPIVYTSADSVFQIAVDTDVIARPYKVIDGKPTRISKDRRDYSMAPKHTILDDIKNKGGKVIAIGKIEDIFAKKGITHAIHTGSNKEGLELTIKAIKNELELDKIAYENKAYGEPTLIFTNLVDTDMLYGHRNDAPGYGKALEEIDRYLEIILKELTDEDLLIITADHGCDPTVEGTDHTRETVPVLVFNKKTQGGDLGNLQGFDNVAKFIKDWIF